MQVSVCISLYWNFALSAIKDEIFLEAKNPSTKSLNLLECFSQFWTICFGTRADESLTKLYLEGVLSTNFKITDWMISQQSALKFLVFSGNKYNSFKAVRAPAPMSILLKSYKLSLSINQSFFSILLALPEEPWNPFCRLDPTVWEKSFLGHQTEMGPNEHHFGKQSNSSQIWSSVGKKCSLLGVCTSA